MQDDGMKGVAAVAREQPVRLPDLRWQSKPDELIRLRQLLGHFALEWRRRKVFGIAEICPHIAAELLGGVGNSGGRLSLAILFLIPGDHDAAACAVEAQPMQYALQVAVIDAPDR